MKRISLLLISGLTLLTLASCSGESKEAETKTPAPVAAEKMAKPAAKNATAGFAMMQAIVQKTKGAIDKGDFATAKTEFAKFEASWKTVEEGVKTKAPKAHTAVKGAVDAVNNSIKAKDKAKTIAALKTLATSISAAAK
jgi:ribosomal protein S20